MSIDKQKFEERMKKIELKPCKLCWKDNWKFVDKIFYLQEYVQDPDLMSNYSYPVIPVVCEHCGNTLFVSAIIANLVNNSNSK